MFHKYIVGGFFFFLAFYYVWPHDEVIEFVNDIVPLYDNITSSAPSSSPTRSPTVLPSKAPSNETFNPATVHYQLFTTIDGEVHAGFYGSWPKVKKACRDQAYRLNMRSMGHVFPFLSDGTNPMIDLFEDPDYVIYNEGALDTVSNVMAGKSAHKQLSSVTWWTGFLFDGKGMPLSETCGLWSSSYNDLLGQIYSPTENLVSCAEKHYFMCVNLI